MSGKMGDRTDPPSDTKVRKTRASKPKVKTGCQTCKIRRVKCDETKPSCLRCVKFGHQCDGYVSKHTTKPSQGSPTGASRMLVPKGPGSSGSIGEGNGIGIGLTCGTSQHSTSSTPSTSPYSPADTNMSSPTFTSSNTIHRSSMPKLYPAPMRSPNSIPSYDTIHTELQRQNYYQSQNYTRSILHETKGYDQRAFENFCTATLPPSSSSCAVSRHAWTSTVSRACNESEEILRAVVVLGGFDVDSPAGRSGEWTGVGTLRHFKAWQGYMKPSSKDFYHSRGLSVGRERELGIGGRKTLSEGERNDCLPSWREQEEEETGSLGQDVVIGLRCLRKWAYHQQMHYGVEGQIPRDRQLMGDLAKSLELRAGLYALQVSSDAREREHSRDRESMERSADEMEV
ncbi:hypothetical protein HYALB_00002642 [Hymenoscyphus albidus]|uniref:Zn(2)-C6 fungal-type domain-containing protein n=1 Tax=Hymenoscyphus albidus TaxID=595503 RepID=A0A9N9LWS2_9HELO|nr:hypothetical protein HYALB_00002642 [Hymenoscyphus albidus]